MALSDALKASTGSLFNNPNEVAEFQGILSRNILSLPSAAGAGGAATAVMSVPGLLASDSIISVSQSTPGANSLPLLGWSGQANNALTAIWSADPGAGSVILVSVKRLS